jgi:two-component sensor histidine kinase
MSEHGQDLRYTWAHNVSGEPIGRTPSEAFGETIGKPLEAILLRGLTEPQSEELGLIVDGNALWLAIQTAPVSRTEGVGVVASALDITHRRQNEQKLEVLARELSHRVKNVFALVQATVHQSARGRGVDPDFLATLDRRLTALAGAQDALLSHDGGKAPLHDLLGSQVAHLSGVTLEGPQDIIIPGRSAPYIALAVHELGTNATKYGSLSIPGGRVRLSWHRSEDGLVTLVWREEGGPRPSSEQGKGFGTQLLTRIFAGATMGKADLTFSEIGLLWRAQFPSTTD